MRGWQLVGTGPVAVPAGVSLCSSRQAPHAARAPYVAPCGEAGSLPLTWAPRRFED